MLLKRGASFTVYHFTTRLSKDGENGQRFLFDSSRGGGEGNPLTRGFSVPPALPTELPSHWCSEKLIYYNRLKRCQVGNLYNPEIFSASEVKFNGRYLFYVKTPHSVLCFSSLTVDFLALIGFRQRGKVLSRGFATTCVTQVDFCLVC